MNKLLEAVEAEKAIEQREKEKALANADSYELIDELINRGVAFSTVWGRYYEHEEAANAHTDAVMGNDEAGQHGKQDKRQPLTVGDAVLAGHTGDDTYKVGF